MIGSFPDIVGLSASEAIEIARDYGVNVEYVSTALQQEHPIGVLRVIRQRFKSPDILELVLCNQPIIWKGGGNGGIQNF